MFRLLLDRLSPRSTSQAAAMPAPPLPDEAFIAIGDIHGRLDLLQRLLDRLAHDHPDLPVILVGDYIDRGEDSAGVLRLLHQRMLADGNQLICLIGNHEDMLLRFLDDPQGKGPIWLRNGGLQTLASFGVGGLGLSSKGADLTRARDLLALKMGDDLINWLRDLPLFWQSGNVVVVHAGADPALPMADQKRASLIWGHKDFLTGRRGDGLWLVHGHTIVGEPACGDGRIAIDTGAYATGRLTGSVISGNDVTFLVA